MLSAISQGHGSWNGTADFLDNDSLPAVDTHHRHGITVTPRKRKVKVVTVEEADDGFISIPKTYLTRKGALVLYSSEKKPEEKAKSGLNDPEKIAKVLERLGNVRRFMASILFLNDHDELEDEDVSISDERNKIFLGFLTSLDNVLYKQKIQPGQDLNFYIKALKMQAKKLGDLVGYEISDQIHRLLATPGASSRPSTTATSVRSGVLSSARLTASLKSATYLGRKIDYPAFDQSQLDFLSSETPNATTEFSFYGMAAEDITKTCQEPDSVSHVDEQLDTKRSDSTAAINLAAAVFDDDSGRVVSASEQAPDSRRRNSRPDSGDTAVSYVTDSSLLDELEITLPGGPEVDSDLEQEYFKSVLNVDDLPRPDVPDIASPQREITSPLDSVRHLTNTPDLPANDAGKSSSRPSNLSPDITLRNGSAAIFNISESHVDEAETPRISARTRTSGRSSSAKTASVRQTPVLPDRPKTVATSPLSRNRSPDLVSRNSRQGITSQASQVKSVNDDPATGDYLSSAKSNSLPILEPQSSRSHSMLASRTASAAHLSQDGPTPSPLSRTESQHSILSDHGDHRPPQSPYERQSVSMERTLSLSSTAGLTLPQSESSGYQQSSLDVQAPAFDSNSHAPVSDDSPQVQASEVTVQPPVMHNNLQDPTAFDSSLSTDNVNSLDTTVLPESAHSVAKPPYPVRSKSARSTTHQPSKKSKINGVNPNKSTSDIDGQRKSESRLKDMKLVLPRQRPTGDPQLDVTKLSTDLPTEKSIDISLLKKFSPDVAARTQSTSKHTELPATSNNRWGDEKTAMVGDEPKLTREEVRLMLQQLDYTNRRQSLKKSVEFSEPLEVQDIMTSRVADEFNDDEGLSLEEMQLAQQLLNEKVEKANKGILKLSDPHQQQVAGKKPRKKGFMSKEEKEAEAKRKELANKRDQLREAKKLEKQAMLSEKRALQEQIANKNREKNALLQQEREKIQALEEEEQMAAAVAEEARRQEDEARRALSESKRLAKEERERRRKEELERRKEEAIRRRENQRRMQDAARQKELEMLEKISDAETVRRLREEERKRKEDEEWDLQRKLAEAERFADLEAADQERRVAQIEKEAEEAAIEKLVQERMEAERIERELDIKRRQALEDESKKREELEEEERKIQEMLRLKEEQGQKKMEEERQRVNELRRIEAEAQEKVKNEIENKRQQLLKLREINLEKKKHLEHVKCNQAYTKPWVFSYYVMWPRDTYEKRIGGEPKKKPGQAKKKK